MAAGAFCGNSALDCRETARTTGEEMRTVTVNGDFPPPAAGSVRLHGPAEFLGDGPLEQGGGVAVEGLQSAGGQHGLDLPGQV